jgi:soluble cytochrome b562
MFVGTFAMLFFGPMLLDGRNHRSGENGLGYYIVVFLLEHPKVQIGISVLTAFGYNIYTFIVNRKIKYIVQVHITADLAEIHLTNLYYSKMKIVQVPLADLSYKIENKVTDNNEKKQKVKFFNQGTSEVVGIIDMKHFFWAENIRAIRTMLAELKSLRL